MTNKLTRLELTWPGKEDKFYELASSLIIKNKYGQQIISDKYNADMLAEAMCKILGYHYKPDSEKYWKQGFSSEKSFIFTTTMSVQEESLDKLAAEVSDDNLLICCSAFVGNKSAVTDFTALFCTYHYVRTRSFKRYSRCKGQE